MTSDHYFPLDLNEEDQGVSYTMGSSSYSSSISSPSFFNPPGEQQSYHSNQLQHHHEDKPPSCDEQSGVFCGKGNETGLKITIRMREDEHDNERRGSENDSTSMKWMSSKMRLMKKMMKNQDHGCGDDQNQFSTSRADHCDQHQGGNVSKGNNWNAIRVCADCNTTKTPLWRSGPRGPKSLCNACGIRQRKARRAAMAAAAGDPIFSPNDTPKKLQSKKKRPNNNGGACVQVKKKRKETPNPTSQVREPSSSKLCFDDLTIILSKSSAFQQVFPQDEREAAILLMALSYGMVNG